MLRSILAVLSGPVVFGMLCVPINLFVTNVFRGSFRPDGTTDRAGMLALLLVLSGLYATASGFVGTWIAQQSVWKHALAMSVLQLSVGIAVQRQYWTKLPVWYHLVFFVMLVVGVFSGAALRLRFQ